MAPRLPTILLTLALATLAPRASAQGEYRRVQSRGQWILVPVNGMEERPLTSPRASTSRAARRPAPSPTGAVQVVVPPEPQYKGPTIPWRWRRPTEDPDHPDILEVLVFDLEHAEVRGEWDKVEWLFWQVRAHVQDMNEEPYVPELEVPPHVYRLAGEAFRRRGALVEFFQVQDAYLPALRHDSPELPSVLSELGLVLDAYHTPLSAPPGIAQLHADVSTLRTYLSTPRPPKELATAAQRARERAAHRLAAWRLEGPRLERARRDLRWRWPKMESRKDWARAKTKRRRHNATLAEERELLRADRHEALGRDAASAAAWHAEYESDAVALYRREYRTYADAVARREDAIEAERRRQFEERRSLLQGQLAEQNAVRRAGREAERAWLGPSRASRADAGPESVGAEQMLGPDPTDTD